MDTLTVAILTAHRESLRAVLLMVGGIPETKRQHVRHTMIQALGAIEDTLEVERTFPPHEARRRERDVVRASS